MNNWAQIAVLALLLSVSRPVLLAQQIGFSIGRPSAIPIATGRAGLNISFDTTAPGSFHRPLLLPPAFYNYPFLSLEYLYQPVAPEYVAPPQFVMVPPPQEPSPEPKPAQLLLIERHGDRFVRIRDSEDEQHDWEVARNESRAAPISEGLPATSSTRSEPQLTVLIFRDRRREEISNYTIVGGILYEATDYWSTGSWTKSVNLALLDLPATVRENRVRGVRFLLPSGPYEVVVR
jgi:hypothetical protein